MLSPLPKTKWNCFSKPTLTISTSIVYDVLTLNKYFIYSLTNFMIIKMLLPVCT
jgi:hypothetical protein